MTDIDAAIQPVRSAPGGAHARRAHLAGDASSRRYERLCDPQTEATAVLMISPGVATGRFVELAAHLGAAGLSAPQVLAAEDGGALLLLEDLGDATFTRSIALHPAMEPSLYQAATDLLAILQALDPPPGLMTLDPASLADMTAIAFSRYAAPITGRDLGPEVAPRLAALFDTHVTGPPVLAHRDYHADNLIWLPSRHGPARVGVLDFQDAVLTHPAYDLVSLLQDARRDVAPGIAEAMIARFRDRSGLDNAAFDAAFAALGLQRNLRILGVFATLASDAGKPQYLSLLPRVHAHVMDNLRHPALADLAEPLMQALPPPTPAVLAQLGQMP